MSGENNTEKSCSYPYLQEPLLSFEQCRVSCCCACPYVAYSIPYAGLGKDMVIHAAPKGHQGDSKGAPGRLICCREDWTVRLWGCYFLRRKGLIIIPRIFSLNRGIHRKKNTGGFIYISWAGFNMIQLSKVLVYHGLHISLSIYIYILAECNDSILVWYVTIISIQMLV